MISPLLCRTSPNLLVTSMVVSAVLLVVASGVCYLPSRRAIDLDAASIEMRLEVDFTRTDLCLRYWCTVISVPGWVFKPLYTALTGWSPLTSEDGTTTLN